MRFGDFVCVCGLVICVCVCVWVGGTVVCVWVGGTVVCVGWGDVCAHPVAVKKI